MKRALTCADIFFCRYTAIGLFFTVFAIFPFDGTAQIGGKRSYEFLNVPSSARLAGLGGANVSLTDRDVNFFLVNPALNGDSLNGMASVSYQFFVGDIGHASIAWQHAFRKIGSLKIGLQHMNYGSIEGYDDAGMPTSSFKAAETALVIGKSHRVGNYTIGANLKGVFSNLAGYHSTALAMDLGVVFKHPSQPFTVGLALRNMGVALSEYSETSKSLLPFDVQIGTTYKPQYMPLRFSVTAFNLTKRNVSYRDPGVETEAVPTLQQILAHFNFGGELLLHKNVNVLLAYNYLNHQALKLDNGGGGAGISVGLSVSVKAVDFVFSRAAYVAGKAAYTFTLSSNLNRLMKRQTL